VDGGSKRFLRHLFREVEIAEKPDQRGYNPAPIGPVKRFNCGGSVLGHTL
jgi:hypothetical protein